ncbi:MAG: hypothetical protein JWP12_1380 [Bacteroidetes bacterium]|nr:hypothetical protein [Bacteroidota bacterium]
MAQKIITYDLVTGTWTNNSTIETKKATETATKKETRKARKKARRKITTLEDLDLRKNETFILKIKGFNPLKYDVTLSYNKKEYTSDVPLLFQNAFDPSAISGMIDNATGGLKFKNINKSPTDPTANKDLNGQAPKDKVKEFAKADQKAFEDNLENKMEEIKAMEKVLLSNLHKLEADNNQFYLDILQKALLPETIPTWDFSDKPSGNDYKRLIGNINTFNTRLLELSVIADQAKTPDNVKKLKASTAPIIDFLTQLKPGLESTVSDYFNLKTKASYFKSTIEQLAEGVELQILSVNDADQLDIAIELSPKTVALDYKIPGPTIYAPKEIPDSDPSDSQKAEKAKTPEKPTISSSGVSTDQTKSCGCCPTVININPDNKKVKADKTTGEKEKKTEVKAKKTDVRDTIPQQAYMMHKYRLPKQTISIPVRNTSYFSYSTGFFASGLTNDSYAWKNKYAADTLSKDSISLIKEKKNYDLGIMSQLHYVPSISHFKKWAIGFDIGAAVNLPDLRLRYSAGPSFIFGNKNQFIISAGVIAGQVDKLSNVYDDKMSLRSDLKPSDLYVRVWNASIYASVSYGFRYIKKTKNNTTDKE